MSFWSELQTLRHFLLPFIFDSRDLTPKFAAVYFMPEAHRHPSLKSLRFFSFLGLTFSTREMPLQPRWWHWSSKPMPVSWPLPQWLSTCVKTVGKSTHHSHFWDANECKWLHATSQMKGAPWQSNLCFWIFIGSSEKKKKRPFWLLLKSHIYTASEDIMVERTMWPMASSDTISFHGSFIHWFYMWWAIFLIAVRGVELYLCAQRKLARRAV